MADIVKVTNISNDHPKPHFRHQYCSDPTSGNYKTVFLIFGGHLGKWLTNFKLSRS